LLLDTMACIIFMCDTMTISANDEGPG
jgi:hypothetical protein